MAPFSLNFDRGRKFQADMRTKFGHPVVFSPGFRQQEFILVVSFYRATFKIDVHTVSVSLLAMFGGYAQGFRVRHLRDRTFKFLVASKSVGFEIYKNGRIVEQDLRLFLVCGIMVGQIGLEKN